MSTPRRYDRTGDRLDDDQVAELEAADEHRCDGGWAGEDALGRPVPCPVCRGERLRESRERFRRAIEGPRAR